MSGRAGSLRSAAAAVKVERLAPVTALLGVLILLLSQFQDAFVLRAEDGTAMALVSMWDQHGASVALIALAALAATVIAVVNGSRPAAAAVAGLGLAVLLIFLIVDLPDLGETGIYAPPDAEVLDVTSEAGGGLWLELVGGLVVAVSGLAMSSLTPRRLSSLKPHSVRI